MVFFINKDCIFEDLKQTYLIAFNEHVLFLLSNDKLVLKRGKSGHQRVAQRITSVQCKLRTSATESKYSSAVVKPGKLCVVQCHVH